MGCRLSSHRIEAGPEGNADYSHFPSSLKIKTEKSPLAVPVLQNQSFQACSQSSKKSSDKHTQSQITTPYNNQYKPPVFAGRNGSVHRRSRVSLSKIDIDGLVVAGQALDQAPIECEDLCLTIVTAKYDDLDCSDEVQDLVSQSGELKLVGGPHPHLLKRKPHYFKTFDLTYAYQTDIIIQMFSIETIMTNGIKIEAPISHEFNLTKALINNIDITEEMENLITERRVFHLPPKSNASAAIMSIIKDSDNSSIKTEDEKDPTFQLEYYFQTPQFSVMCHGNEDLHIPNYDTALACQPELAKACEERRGVNNKNAPARGLWKSFSQAHLVVSKSSSDEAKDINETDDDESSNSSVIKAVPLTMRGYINKENSKNVWLNRYFILDSTEHLAHISYYRRQTSKYPFGKDLMGEFLLTDVTMSIQGDLIVLRLKERPNEGMILQIKEEEYRQQWVRAMKEHLAYAEFETKKTMNFS